VITVTDEVGYYGTTDELAAPIHQLRDGRRGQANGVSLLSKATDSPAWTSVRIKAASSRAMRSSP